MRRLTMLSLGVMVTALLLAACGSDDELSEEEFLAQANEICQVGNDQLNETFESFFPADAEPTEEEVLQILEENAQTIVDDYVNNIGGQIDDIRGLNGPSDLEDELDPILDEASGITDEISEGSPEEFLLSEDDPYAPVTAQLEAIGLTTCAE